MSAEGVVMQAGDDPGLSSAVTNRATRVWHRVQWLLLGAGMVLVLLLFLRPGLGLDLLWNGLIPLAPALLVVAPGVWRNVCPMATWSLLPHRLGISERRVPDQRTAARLRLGGVAALLLIVPARHLWFDTDGYLSGVMLVAAALCALWFGMAWERRSGWCATACPIHPVEKLYGLSPAVSVANARCERCDRCSAPCPDSTRAMHPAITGPSRLEAALGHVIIGGFAGFICGWFQVPDYHGAATPHEALLAFLWPFGGALVSLMLYTALRATVAVSHAARRRLIRIFAAAAVSSYYAFRLPALVGLGLHPGTGRLVDWSGWLPAWAPWLSAALTTAFFFWFLVVRRESGVSWNSRPARA
jgi:hypothetical protein